MRQKKKENEKEKLEGLAHVYNPSTLGSQGGHIALGQEFETSLANTVKPRLYYEIQKSARHCGRCLQSQLLRRLR